MGYFRRGLHSESFGCWRWASRVLVTTYSCWICNDTSHQTPRSQQKISVPRFWETNDEALGDLGRCVYCFWLVQSSVFIADNALRRGFALSELPRSSSRFFSDAVLVLERQDGRPGDSSGNSGYGGAARLRRLSSWARRSSDAVSIRRMV